MSKFVLEIEDVFDFDFSLIGISCHSKDYRLCWEINKALDIELERKDDYQAEGSNSSHSFSQFIDDDNYLEYYFISNRSKEGYLIPEQNRVDYFLLIKGNTSDDLTKDMICKINTISLVLTSFEIEPEQLKSKENLLF